MRKALRVYSGLIGLYPKDFRDHYRDDLLQHFADLVDRRGWRSAGLRIGLDLLVSVPRYRLESILNVNGNTALAVIICLFAAGGAVSLAAGLLPGLVLLLVACAIALGQRSNLARALNMGSDQRRGRIAVAAVFAAACVGTVVIGVADLSGEEAWGDKVLAYNAAFLLSLLGALGFAIAALLTRKA